MTRKCKYAKCERDHYGRGYCQGHYKRAMKGADMSTPFRIHADDEARFWSKIHMTPECWLWTSPPGAQGYGGIRYGGKNRTAHRVSYEINVGPIPEGMQIDHACRNRLCVNPDHLRIVTDAENKQNIVAYKTSKSGIRGVSYYPKRRKWLAMVRQNGKQNYLGWHTSAKSAEDAVTEFRRKNMPYSEMDKRRKVA